MSEIKKDNELQVTKLSDLTPEKLAEYEKRTASFNFDDLLVFYKTDEVQVSDCKHPTVIAGVKCIQCEIERLKEENKRLNEYIKQTSPRVDVDLCYTQNARYRMALETIATETIEPAYSTQIATRWRMIAREAVGEVLGE